MMAHRENRNLECKLGTGTAAAGAAVARGGAAGRVVPARTQVPDGKVSLRRLGTVRLSQRSLRAADI